MNINYQALTSHLVSLLLALCLPGLLTGQDARADFDRINQGYLQSEQYQLEVQIEVYPGPDATDAIQTNRISVKRMGKQFHTQQGEIETLVNARYGLLINHQKKKIVVQPAAYTQLPDQALFVLDSTLSQWADIDYQRLSPQAAAYHLRGGKGAYTRMSVYFHPKSFHLQKLVFFPRKKMRVAGTAPHLVRFEVVFEQFRAKARFSEADFSERPFIRRIKGQLQPHTPFQHYELISYLR